MKIFGTHDANTLAQLEEVAQDAEHVALMADGHLGFNMPIGGVAAYRGKVSVTGVGFDIACGNIAIKTERRQEDFSRSELVELGHSIQRNISFGIGGQNPAREAPRDHALFDRSEWDIVPASHREPLRDKARRQLGTIGAGNHYVDIFVDEAGFLWIGVHFGSRGFGHTIASSFLALSQDGEWGDRGKETPALLDLDTQLGHDYWCMMELAGQYAYAGRLWVANKVATLLQADQILDTVHNNHNFAWLEGHFGRQYVVVRKGATPAFPGERGFVGGSMGDDAVILQGTRHGSSLQYAALFSTVHGAGRVMSRTAARGKINRRKKIITSPGKVKHAEVMDWIRERGVLVFGGDLDESPQAYRRLDDVLADQGDTIEVLHTLRPLVVVMASGYSGTNPFLECGR